MIYHIFFKFFSHIIISKYTSLGSRTLCAAYASVNELVQLTVDASDESAVSIASTERIVTAFLQRFDCLS